MTTIQENIKNIIPEIISIIQHGPVIFSIISRERLNLKTEEYSERSITKCIVCNDRGVIIQKKGSNPIRNVYTSESKNTKIWFLGKFFDNVFFNSDDENNRSFRNSSIIAEMYDNNPKAFFYDLQYEGLFVINEKNTNSIAFYSDKIGKEDFYYYFDGNTFACCNLIAPLAKVFSKKYDSVGLINYLATGTVLGPLTLFKDVQSLLPSRRINVIKNGAFTTVNETELYWELPKPIPPNSYSQTELEKYFSDSYLKAIERRILKENRVFLSGGLDSSSIVGTIQNNFKSKVYSFNYRIKGYSPQLVETEIIERFQKDFKFDLKFLDVDSLSDSAYESWREFSRFSPDYFNISSIVLTEALKGFIKEKPGYQPFLTGETADSIIDFWCGVKGNGLISDSLANLNRFLYSPNAVFLAKAPISNFTGWIKPLSNSLYQFFQNKGILRKFYKYIDLLNSIVYSFGRPEIFYSGRMIGGTPGWSSQFMQTPNIFKYSYDKNLVRITKSFTKSYTDRITKENMMQVYAVLLMNSLSYTDMQIYKRVCNYYDQTIQFPFLDSEFMSMTTALPFKERAFKTLFRRVGKNLLGLPDYITDKQKIDFFIKEDKPIHQTILEMPIGRNIKEGLRDCTFLNNIDEDYINVELINREIEDYVKRDIISPRLLNYQTLEWSTKDVLN